MDYDLLISELRAIADRHWGTLHTTCKESAEAIAALRSEVERLREERRWIPVGERLPEQSQIVNVWMYYYPPNSDAERAFFRKGRWFVDDMNMTPISDLGVTHWMPLPSGPEN